MLLLKNCKTIILLAIQRPTWHLSATEWPTGSNRQFNCRLVLPYVLCPVRVEVNFADRHIGQSVVDKQQSAVHTPIG
jgi:hypothetical protein